MADLHVQYALTTPGTDITFNTGVLGDGTDKYWISAIQGLDGPIIRSPIDLVPFGDGSIIHTFRKGGRVVTIDGSIWVEAFTNQTDCQERRNDLVQDMLDALGAIITASGTLAWTPTGQSAKSLAVYCQVGPNITYSSNFTESFFNFTLVSAAADPS